MTKKDDSAPTGDVTESEVHHAADYWVDLGVERPTPSLIKLRLGRGSNSTIGKYLLTHSAKPKLDFGPMPQALGERGMRTLEAFFAWSAAAAHEKTTAMVQAANDRASAAERTLAHVSAAADESARALELSETRAETNLNRAQTLAGKLRAADAEVREFRRRMAGDRPVRKAKAKKPSNGENAVGAEA